MKGTYLNEKITIIKETNETYEIEFTDGFTEFVPKSAVTIIPKQKARTRVKPSNPKRRKENFKKYYGSIERVSWIQSLPCIICKTRKYFSENVHIKSRGSGGGWKYILPMCHNHHAEIHSIGAKTFEEKYNIDLLKEAEEYAKILP